MSPVTIRISKKRLRCWRFLLCVILLAAAVMLVGARLRPVITEVFKYQAEITATRSINDAVLSVISESGARYDAIIRTHEDESGRVSFLETDMVEMNRIKSQIANEVADRLAADAKKTVDLPLGTVLGGDFFAGRGPLIEFRVAPAGYARTDFYNEFQTAGINQTLHQIMISVEVPVSAVMPFYMISTEVSTSVCIAETVIVGEIPQSFTEINGDERGALDKLGDYKAGG